MENINHQEEVEGHYRYDRIIYSEYKIRRSLNDYKELTINVVPVHG